MNDGGPAFPMASMDITKGMLLLDWFAGQALIGYLSGDMDGESWPEDAKLARWSYEVANAMLAERERIMKYFA